MTFEQALSQHVSGRQRRLRDVLSDRNPRRRARRLARMEQHARVQLGVGRDDPVDWSRANIDWASIIQMILKLLSFILAL